MRVPGVAAVRRLSRQAAEKHHPVTIVNYGTMMSYSKIKKYYFTACAVLFVLLLLLTLMRDGWTLTPQSLLSMLVGWLLLCAVIIGVVYLVVGRRRTKAGDTPDGEAADRE